MISAQDVDTIYEVPLAFHEQGLDDLIVSQLGLESQAPQADLAEWRNLVATIREPSGGEASIAIVGKYVELEDSYKSLREALTHGGVANNLRVRREMDRVRRVDGRQLRGSFARLRCDPGSWRIWQTRCCGNDSRDLLRAQNAHAIFSESVWECRRRVSSMRAMFVN